MIKNEKRENVRIFSEIIIPNKDFSLIDRDRKIIFSKDRTEYYNLREDPGELNNIVNSQEYSYLLPLIKKQINSNSNLKNKSYFIPVKKEKLSPEIIEELKALGYM